MAAAVIPMKQGVWKQEVVNVTASVARKYLATNTHNRNISKSRVDTYATDMLDGNWHLTHQGIAFSSDGVLMDGQHRLMAVVLAQEIADTDSKKISIPMLVTWGVKKEPMAVIDGMLVRKVGDQLHLFDGLDNGRMYESGCRVILFIEKRSYGGKLTVDIARDIIDRHKTGLSWAIGTCSRDPVRRAPMVGAFAYAYPTNPEKVAQFVIMVRDGTGEGWTKGHPAHTLREWLLRMEFTSHRDRTTVTVIALRALMAFLRGHPLLVIKQDAMTSEAAINETCKFFSKAHNRKKEE